VGAAGVQDWLSFYFQAPMPRPGKTAVHDLFRQLRMLKNELRRMQGVAPVAMPSSPSLEDLQEEFEQVAAPAA
jgi:hypothetical protein